MTASTSVAEDGEELAVEFWGTATVEGRLFADAPLYPGQRRNSASISFEPTLYIEGEESGSFTLTPYVRIDGSDRERTHLDVREAYGLWFGEFENSEWELRVGIDQVFWGVAESNNPVNIINTPDLVDSADGREKLGQPMIHGTLGADWGILELFILPWHRPVTFPGTKGRLRGPLPVDNDRDSITYEAGSGRRHVDYAARYSNSVGPIDIGLSLFDGTSRQPLLLPADDLGQQVQSLANASQMIQHYNHVRQVGLDMQVTMDAFLGKAEIVARDQREAPGTDPATHHAWVVGGEYTVYAIGGSDADLTLFAELNQDERREKSTSALQNDLFLAARYSFNDVQDTDLRLAVLDDLDYETRTMNFEFNRRITDSTSLSVEAFAVLDSDKDDQFAHPIRKDGFIGINFRYSF